jgi:hypothetical protein
MPDSDFDPERDAKANLSIMLAEAFDQLRIALGKQIERQQHQLEGIDMAARAVGEALNGQDKRRS